MKDRIYRVALLPLSLSDAPRPGQCWPALSAGMAPSPAVLGRQSKT